MKQERKNTNRIEKVNSHIQHELGPILHEFLAGGEGLVTISKVETSKDMKWAKVWVSILPTAPSSGLRPPSPRGRREQSLSQENPAPSLDEKILKRINSNLYDIQGQLNSQFATKVIPRISFYLDTSPRYAQRIDELINRIHEEE